MYVGLCGLNVIFDLINDIPRTTKQTFGCPQAILELSQNAQRRKVTKLYLQSTLQPVNTLNIYLQTLCEVIIHYISFKPLNNFIQKSNVLKGQILVWYKIVVCNIQ